MNWLRENSLKKIFRGRALYTEEDKIWVARGMSFWGIDYNGKKTTKKYKIGGLKQKVLSAFRLTRQLFREGIHHLVPMPNGNFFVVAKKKAYTVGCDGKIKYVFSGYRGNKPGHQGVCVTPDGNVFFAEYTLNSNRDHDTVLYRSTNCGESFDPILTLSKNQVRHMHFIKYDPYEKCLWLGTGDEDFECKLMRSFDNGNSWETVGEGCQDWRAIGVCFSEDNLVWGTDAGSVPDQNHIIRMSRKTREIEIVADAEGPCHGCASFKNGQVYISTGVEGGENEKDRFARLKKVDDGIKDIFLLKKDIFPLILQYGVMRFPLGTENTNKLVFTAMGLKKGGEIVYVEEKENGI